MTAPEEAYPPNPNAPASRGGSEAALSRWSGFFAVVAVLSFVAGTIAVIAWADQRVSGLLSVTVLCAATGLSSMFSSAVLRGAADVVRLLKKLNGLPYDGEI